MRTAKTAAMAAAVAAMVIGLAAARLHAADQTWTGGSAVNGNWSTGANWSGGAAPGSTSLTTSTDVATFNAAIANTWGNAAGNPVVIDSASQNIGGLTFTGSPGNYFVGSTGGNSLLLSSGGTTQITSGLGVTNPVVTINAPLQVQGGSGAAYTFSNNMGYLNSGSYVGLQLLGGITGMATAGNTTVLTLTGSHWNGNNGYYSSRISGIGDGSAGGKVAVRKTGTGAWVLSGTNTYSGGVALDQGTLVFGSGTTQLGTGTLTINGGETSGSTASGSINLSSNPVVINGDFTMKGEYYVYLGSATLGTAAGTTRTITVTASNPQYIQGIANGTTANSIVKSGSGALRFNAASTYTGTTTMAAGTLEAWGPGATVATSLIRFTGNSSFGRTNITTDQSLGALEFAGGDGLLYMGNGGGPGSKLVTFSSLTPRAAGATGNFKPAIVGENGGGANGTVNGFRLTGVSAGLIGQGYYYRGADFAYLNTAGGYVREPVYDTDPNFASFAGGASLPDNAAMNYNVTGAVTAQGTASANTLRINGAATIDLTQSAGTTLTLASGGLLRSGGGATTISGGTLAASSNVEYVFRTDVAADTLTIASTLSANGVNALTKSGAGVLQLSAANTFSGDTRVNAGTLILTNNLALQNSAFDTSGAGTLSLISVNTPTFGGLKGGSNLVLPSNVTSLTLNPGTGVTNTYTGNLSGGTSATLAKTGAGTQILSGANSYAGATTVSGGTLLVNGSIAGSGVTVNSGAVVGGSGTITPTAGANVAINGTLAPGGIGTAGTLTFNLSGASKLSFGAGSTLAFDLGTSSDLVAFGTAGNWLSGSGNTTLALTLGAGFSYSNTYTIFQNATTTGYTLAGIAGYDTTNYNAIFALSGNNYVLSFQSMIPEPATLALVALGALGLVVRRWE